MKQVYARSSIIALTFLWLGFLGAISFMEAWLKFQAPGVDLATGLGIGKLVFAALNKVEWVLAIGMLISLSLLPKRGIRKLNLAFVFPFLILVIQSVWLLPVLDQRADMHIQGLAVPDSNLHFYYVALEFAKAISLVILGIGHLKKLVWKIY